MELMDEFNVTTLIKITGTIKLVSAGMYECKWSDGDKTMMSRQEVEDSFSDGLWKTIPSL